MKRLLFLAHRWLGIVLCLFMMLWFFSGVVMMYVGYPKLTQQEHLQHLPKLSGDCCLPAQAVLAALPPGESAQGLRLTSTGHGPVYIVTLEKNRFVALDARIGAVLPAVDKTVALKSAALFAPNQPLQYRDLMVEDAWTHSRALDGHRPLHRIEAGGQGETLVYVSGKTGEVVRDASLTERRWNWVGAWLHWLYPLRGGSLNGWWTAIVVYSSLAATLLSALGLWIGVLRWRRRCYNNGSHSPYRTQVGRWHHWSGLIFGVLVVTWILSGLMSMNPWRIFDSSTARPVRQVLPMAPASLDSAAQLACLQRNGFTAVELVWTRLGDAGFVLARNARGESRLQPESRCDPMVRHDFSALETAGAALLPAASVKSATIQEMYDWHYYTRDEHTMSGHLGRPLPVLRLQFDDAAGTWLYLDPHSGNVVHRSDRPGRVKRVLFALLHSWDWAPLLANRPLWDVLMILGSLGGFMVSLTGVLLGWRRLVRCAC